MFLFIFIFYMYIFYIFTFSIFTMFKKKKMLCNSAFEQVHLEPWSYRIFLVLLLLSLCKSWKVTKRIYHVLKVFHNKCLMDESQLLDNTRKRVTYLKRYPSLMVIIAGVHTVHNDLVTTPQMGTALKLHKYGCC